MLIRIFDDELVEFPNDLAVQIVATPTFNALVPDYSIEEINALIHGVLGALFEEDWTLEQNIAEVRNLYASRLPPSTTNLEKALALINNYNQNIDIADIAHVSADLAFPCGGNNYQLNRAYAISQAPTPITVAATDLQSEPALAIR